MFGYELVSKKLMEQWCDQLDNMGDIKDWLEMEIYTLRRVVDHQKQTIDRLQALNTDLFESAIEELNDVAEQASVDMGVRNVIITNLQNELVDQEEVIRAEMELNMRYQNE